MKTYSKILLAAAVAASALSACSREPLEPASAPKGNLVEVHFGAESKITAPTRATLTTEDEATFKSAWTNGDDLSVEYMQMSTEATAIVSATWNGSSFASSLPEGTDEWAYDAVYPVPDSEGKTDFGSARTQKGNAYNSKYDLMKGSVVTENAAAGKTDDGKDIVFPMDRQTAIAYFHFTGSLEEDLVSAKLSVEGGSIATSSAAVSSYSKGYVLSTDDANALSEITLTFEEGTAPKASDCQLWFNVLPTEYTKMTLSLETASHTLAISRTPSSGTDAYVAGNLYKVVKEISADAWVSKTPAESSYTIEFNSTVANVATISTTTKASTFVVNGAEYITTTPFSSVTNAYYGGDKDGLPLRIGKKNNGAGSITISLSEQGQVDATKIILSAKQYSSGKTNKIGVNGSEKQQPGDDYGNLEFTLDGNEISTIKLDSDGYVYVKSITVVYSSASSTKYNVTCSEVTGGTITASASKAKEGSEVTVTVTPSTGYDFNNDLTVKDSNGAEVTVTDGKFTMPAKDVTVSGSFKKLTYTITKTAATGGSFTVKVGETEVTEASYDDVVALAATASEGYEFDKWTVTDLSTNKTVYVSDDSFTMPAANVSVAANFLQSDVVPVYASLSELIAAGTPTSTGALVTVTLSDEKITKLAVSGSYTNGVYFMVGTQEIEIYSKDTPSNWAVGGYVSGTLTKCKWMLYNSTWELCPDDYTELSYTAPVETPVITLNGAVATITCATDGVKIYYTAGDSPADPTSADTEYTAPVTLTDGQTIKAIAIKSEKMSSEVASKKYSASGASEVTVTMSTFTATSANAIGDDTNLSYSTDKGGAGTAPGVYSDAIRLYQGSSSTAGGSITIKAADGVKINKVIIGSSTATSISYTLDSSTTKSTKASLTKNGKYTVDSIEASSITFYCMGTTKDTRLNVNYLSITYTK